MSLLLENGADVNSRNYCGQVRDFDVFSLLGFVGIGSLIIKKRGF